MKKFMSFPGVILVVVCSVASLWAMPLSVRDVGEKVDKAEAAKKELDDLQGSWKLICHEEDGKVVDYGGDTQIYKYEKGNLTVKRNENLVAEGTIELDATRSPKQMDYRINNGQIDPIIYFRVGEFMIQCDHRDGKTRPTEFATNTPNGGAYLIVLQRQK
jgi:uncharacterized protein (TIGR03067 family)